MGLGESIYCHKRGTLLQYDKDRNIIVKEFLFMRVKK